MVGAFVAWLKVNDVDHVVGIRPWHIRAYLVSLQRRGLGDTTQHAHARGIKTWLRWLVGEGDLEASPMANVASWLYQLRVLSVGSSMQPPASWAGPSGGRPQSPVRQPSRLITQTCASGRRQLSVMPLSLTEGLEAF